MQRPSSPPILRALVLAALGASPGLTACRTAAPVAADAPAEAAASEAPATESGERVAQVSVVGLPGGGGQMHVMLDVAAIRPAAAGHVETPAGTFALTPDGAPAADALAASAAYRLSPEARAAVEAAGQGAMLRLTDGVAVHRYRVRRVDWSE